jgi:hypothetical protein
MIKKKILLILKFGEDTEEPIKTENNEEKPIEN